MRPPIVFLDIDGVLVTPGSAKRPMQPLHLPPYRYHQFARHAVDALNKLTSRAGAAIVISSSWRTVYRQSIIQIMREQGVNGTVIDSTPVIPGPRGLEIQAWMDTYPYYEGQPFVILDDEDDMEHLRPRLVQTTWFGHPAGLREKHVRQALRILQETP